MSEGGRVHSNDTFGKLPKELMHDHNITDGAKVLYAHMHWRYGLNHKNFESMASMAEILCVKEKTISRRVEELEKARWIVVLNRRKRGGNYTTNFYHVFESKEKCIAWLQAPDEIEEGDEIRLPLEDDHQTKMSDGRQTKMSGGRQTKMSDNTDTVIQTHLNIGDKSQNASKPALSKRELLDVITIVNGMSSVYGVDELADLANVDKALLLDALPEMAKAKQLDYDAIGGKVYRYGEMVKPVITIDDFAPYKPNFEPKHSLNFVDVKDALLEAFKVQGEGTREHSLAGKTAKELIAAQVHADEVQSLYDFVASELKKMGTTFFKVSALPNHVTKWRIAKAGKSQSTAGWQVIKPPPTFVPTGGLSIDDVNAARGLFKDA